MICKEENEKEFLIVGGVSKCLEQERYIWLRLIIIFFATLSIEEIPIIWTGALIGASFRYSTGYTEWYRKKSEAKESHKSRWYLRDYVEIRIKEVSLLNFKYWDKHKLAAVITGLIFIFSFALTFITGDMEDRAMEQVVDTISQEEAEAIVGFFDSYEQKLPALYHSLDELGSWLALIILGGSLISAWTALDIPERYRKEPSRVMTPTPTTVPESTE